MDGGLAAKQSKQVINMTIGMRQGFGNKDARAAAAAGGGGGVRCVCVCVCVCRCFAEIKAENFDVLWKSFHRVRCGESGLEGVTREA